MQLESRSPNLPARRRFDLVAACVLFALGSACGDGGGGTTPTGGGTTNPPGGPDGGQGMAMPCQWQPPSDLSGVLARWPASRDMALVTDGTLYRIRCTGGPVEEIGPADTFPRLVATRAGDPIHVLNGVFGIADENLGFQAFAAAPERGGVEGIDQNATYWTIGADGCVRRTDLQTGESVSGACGPIGWGMGANETGLFVQDVQDGRPTLKCARADGRFEAAPAHPLPRHAVGGNRFSFLPSIRGVVPGDRFLFTTVRAGEGATLLAGGSCERGVDWQLALQFQPTVRVRNLGGDEFGVTNVVFAGGYPIGSGDDFIFQVFPTLDQYGALAILDEPIPPLTVSLAGVTASALLFRIDTRTGTVRWARGIRRDVLANGRAFVIGPDETIWFAREATGVTVLDDTGDLVAGLPIAGL